MGIAQYIIGPNKIRVYGGKRNYLYLDIFSDSHQCLKFSVRGFSHSKFFENLREIYSKFYGCLDIAKIPFYGAF